MEKQEFYDVVETLIVPLFTGSFLAGEMESTSRDLEVALGRGNSVLLKPTKLDDYRLILKRGQAFKSFEINLMRAIIRELDEISSMDISDKMYLSQLNSIAIEKAPHAQMTVYLPWDKPLPIMSILRRAQHD